MADEHAEPTPEPTAGNAAGKPSRIDAYHEQFAEKMIKALEAERAPWQKPWKPGERMSQRNFTTDTDYRGSNAMFLAVTADQKGYSDSAMGRLPANCGGGRARSQGRTGHTDCLCRVQVTGARKGREGPPAFERGRP